MSKGLAWIKNNSLLVFSFSSLFPIVVHASFIESTIGTAVVNDATASYYNPAALTLLKNPQIIPLVSYAFSRTQFSGQAIGLQTGSFLSGSTTARTRYSLPSFYAGLPSKNKHFFVGLALLSNEFGRDTENTSILRYVQSSNNIQDMDLTLAMAYKFNDCFAVGAGLSLSENHFLLKPIFGFRSLNIPDSQSRNDTRARGVGGDLGFLIKPTKSTTMGFNYRSAVTYHESGKSVLESNPPIVSEHYGFTLWTPARSVFSISQLLSKKFGLVGTIKYFQWDIFKDIHIHNIATPLGILPNATAHYHLHNSWIFTVGGIYRMTEKWVVRAATSYVQSPATGKFQISNGDEIVVGASTGYDINKHMTIDASYAHSFIQHQNIHITRAINEINGTTTGSRDGVSLKLTLNI